MPKSVKLTVSGPGSIKPEENCTYDATASELTWINDSLNCAFSVVIPTVGMKCKILTGDYSLPDGTYFVLLEANGEYAPMHVDIIPGSIDDFDEFCEDLLR